MRKIMLLQTILLHVFWIEPRDALENILNKCSSDYSGRKFHLNGVTGSHGALRGAFQAWIRFNLLWGEIWNILENYRSQDTHIGFNFYLPILNDWDMKAARKAELKTSTYYTWSFVTSPHIQLFPSYYDNHNHSLLWLLSGNYNKAPHMSSRAKHFHNYQLTQIVAGMVLIVNTHPDEW